MVKSNFLLLLWRHVGLFIMTALSTFEDAIYFTKSKLEISALILVCFLPLIFYFCKPLSYNEGPTRHAHLIVVYNVLVAWVYGVKESN